MTRLRRAVAAIALAAFAVRLLALGHRVAHFDEARVAWWTLEFAATREFHYRPVIHGPFLRIVNARVFDLVGASDFTMRLVPAVVGGLLPLAALPLRAHLRDREVVVVALFLAFNPALLYFSRFSRGDPLVGAFAFAAFAVAAWGWTRRDPRAVVPAGLLLALGLTVKENALLYPVAWLGALVLVADHRLLVGREDRRTLRARLRAVPGHARTLAPYLALTVVGALAVLAFFYAPRSPGPGVGIGDVSDPGQWGALLEAALVAPPRRLANYWVGNRVGRSGNPFLLYFAAMVKNVAFGGVAVCTTAALGWAVERYSGDPRDLVGLCAYWGLLSVLGYPLVSDLVDAPWLAVHALLPLTVPAAVGVVAVYEWGASARERGDDRRAAAAAVALLLVAGSVAGMATYTSYAAPQSETNQLVQYAQPGGHMQPTLREMEARADGEGTDVLFYGPTLVDGARGVPRTPACIRWFRTLPLPWYLRAHGVNVSCAPNASDLRAHLSEERPPFVVAAADVDPGGKRVPPELRSLSGYQARTYLVRSHDVPGQTDWVVVLVRE